MGRKYEFKADSNPGPGTYETERAEAAIRHYYKLGVIREETSPYRRPKEIGPSPGAYDGHLKPFGSGLKNVTMGGKNKFKPLTDSVGPGAYDFAYSQSTMLPRSRSAIIRNDTNPYRRQKEGSPDPGQYDNHLTPFASKLNNVSMGSKYQFKADSNPPPGLYNPDLSMQSVMPRSRGAVIKEDTMPYRRPKD